MKHLGRAYLAQWIKLRRPTVFLGVVATSVFFAVLTTVLIFTHLTQTPPSIIGSDNSRGIYIGLVQASNGLVYGFGQSAGLLGLVAIVAFAFALASEYTYGTLRNLLVRQPRRIVLLVGSYLAFLSLIVLTVILAEGVSIIAAYLVAPSQGVATHVWSITQAGKTFVDVTLSMIGYGTFGAALGLLLRSPVAAIGVAVGWSVAVENILAATLNGSDKWLPGKLFTALAANGAGDITFTRALIMGGVYTLAIAVIAVIVFCRRDVSS